MKLKEILIITGLSGIISLTTFVMLLLVATAADAKILDMRGPNVVLAIGEVDQSYLGKAQFMDAIPDKTIDIVINSPGGNVMIGNIFIQAMEASKAQGKTIRCVVTNMAASMAMHILAHCDQRYALKGAYLLYHEARMPAQGMLTARELRRMAEGMEILTYELDLYMVEQLGVTPEFYKRHNEAETFWTAEVFRENHEDFDLEIVSDVIIDKKFRRNIFDPIGPATVDGKRGYFEELGSPIYFPGSHVMQG